MKFRQTIKILIALICFTSCIDDDNLGEPDCVNNVYLLTRVLKGKHAFTDSIERVYGIGKDAKPIYVSKDYYSLHSSSRSSLFQLPLDLNSDKCGFVFLREDKSRDTIAFSYKILRTLDNKRCGMEFFMRELKVTYFSNRFRSDTINLLEKYGESEIQLFLK
ncbi:MAG: DUF6452 family protein [Bacteroidia bacterium]